MISVLMQALMWNVDVGPSTSTTLSNDMDINPGSHHRSPPSIDPVFWFLCRTKLQSLYFLSYIWSSNSRYKYCSFFPIKMLLPNISSVAYRQNIGSRTFPQVFFLLQVYFKVLWSSSKSYTTQWSKSWGVLQVVNPVLFQVFFLLLPQDSIQVIYKVLCQVFFSKSWPK